MKNDVPDEKGMSESHGNGNGNPPSGSPGKKENSDVPQDRSEGRKEEKESGGFTDALELVDRDVAFSAELLDSESSSRLY